MDLIIVLCVQYMTCSQESGAAQYHTEVAFYHSVGPVSAFRSTNGDNAGLYAVNPKNQVNHYAEIVTQYAEVDEKGQGKETPIWNNEYENSSHSKVGCFSFAM